MPIKAGTKAKYIHERLVSPRKFDPRSFRVIPLGKGKKGIIGCPLDYWDNKRKRCLVGTRLQAILHPKASAKNPYTRTGLWYPEKGSEAAKILGRHLQLLRQKRITKDEFKKLRKELEAQEKSKALAANPKFPKCCYNKKDNPELIFLYNDPKMHAKLHKLLTNIPEEHKQAMMKGLKDFYLIHKTLPNKIKIYNDGEKNPSVKIALGESDHVVYNASKIPLSSKEKYQWVHRFGKRKPYLVKDLKSGRLEFFPRTYKVKDFIYG